MATGLLASDPAALPVVTDVERQRQSTGPRVLVFTTLFPNPAQPRLGIFVRSRVAAVAEQCPTRVVAPVLSRLGPRQLEPGSRATVPSREQEAGIEVYHPRFATVPGVGRFGDGALLFLQTVSAVRRLWDESRFDLIDAHYAFPDGAAAVLLGKHFGVPVCVTLRGGDIDVLLRFRMRRRMIRRTLQRADRVFAVSRHLAAGAVALGLRAESVRVIANGIDPNQFYCVEKSIARRDLRIPAHHPLVVCVGNIEAEKGQHVLIEALARLDARSEPPPHLAIIGSVQWGQPAYQQEIERRANALGLSERIHMVGSKPQAELRAWYNAADVVALPTFREGCPNVVREALACGAPVVASRVGGVPELITSEALGVLVEPGDVRGLAEAIGAALRQRWDRAAIAAVGGQRTWKSVASTMLEEFRALVREPAH